jgi:hypothetical protein
MKLWQRAFLTNIALLLGIGSSLFVLPPNVPFFTWLIGSSLVFVTFNIVMFARFKRAASDARPKTSKPMKVIGALCVAFWILDILVHLLRR